MEFHSSIFSLLFLLLWVKLQILIDVFIKLVCYIFKEELRNQLHCTLWKWGLSCSYKNTIQGLLENSKRYPQYADYYQQYTAILLEEAEAIKKVEAAKRKTTPAEEIKFYLPNENEDEPQQPSLSEDYSNSYESQFPPIPSRSQKPTISLQSSDPNTLTKSDIQYAAAGVVNQMKQFDNEYHVTEKCKNAYNACATKAKELNEKYEVLISSISYI